MKTPKDLTELNNHLNKLNGQISVVKTRYNAEGKKVRIIKLIKRKEFSPHRITLDD